MLKDKHPLYTIIERWHSIAGLPEIQCMGVRLKENLGKGAMQCIDSFNQFYFSSIQFAGKLNMHGCKNGICD